MKRVSKCSAMLPAMAALLVSTAALADNIVSIGFSGPINGLSGSSGTSMLNAAKMAIDDVNHADLRINGEKLSFQLLVQDDKSNPRIAEIAANYFVKSGVVGVVGIFNSTIAISSSGIYQKAGIPHFAVSGIAQFTHQGHDTAFRFAASDEQITQALATYAAQDLHKSRVAIIHDDSAVGRNYRKEFESVFGKTGGEVTSVSIITPTTSDFNDILKSIRDSKTDTILFGGLALQSAMFARSMYRTDPKMTLITRASVIGPMFLQTAGPGAEGTTSVAPGAYQEKHKLMDTFEKNYKQLYNTAVGPYSAIAYDEVQVLAAAVVRAGSTDPRKINSALHELRYNGLSGNIAFNANGDLRELTLSIYRVKNAAWAPSKQYRISAND